MPTKHDNCQTCDRPECDRAIVYTVGGPVPACAGLAVDWRTRAITAERLLADERAAHAETSRDLDALLTALGAQVTPGGQTEGARQARLVADGMRRARELVAAREVPPDVEAAIRTLVDGVHFCALEIDDPKEAEGLPGFPGWPDMGSPMVDALRAAIAKAIADAEERGRTDGTSAPSDVEAAISDLVEASRDLEVYAEGKVTAKRTKSAEAEFGRARTALRTAIAAEIERGLVSARARFDCARSVFFNDMLRRRNITSPCQECEGYGVLAYPSTATWRRGAGGQMSTYDVCDRCWGSGDAVKHGVDLRRLGAEIERARAEGRGETKASALPPIDAAAEKMVDGLVAASRTAAGKRTAIAKAAPAPVARPISEWHEDSGSALWWRFPIEEPPYSGTPLDSDWPGYHTHWTPIVCPDEPHSEADADPASRGPIGGGS